MSAAPTPSASARGLCEFIDGSPSPFHACATAAARLTEAGYTQLSEADQWPDDAGRYRGPGEAGA